MKISNTTLFILISIGFTACSEGELKVVHNYKTLAMKVDRTESSPELCLDLELVDEDTFTHKEAKYWEEKMNFNLEKGVPKYSAEFEKVCNGKYLSSDYISCSFVISKDFHDWGNYTNKDETKLNMYFKIPEEFPAELVNKETLCSSMESSIARDSGKEENPIVVSLLINISGPYEKDTGEVIDAEGSYCLDYSFENLKEFTAAQMDYILEEGGLYEEGEYTGDGVSFTISHHRGKSCAQLKGTNATSVCGTFNYTEAKENGLSSLLDPPRWFAQDGSDTLKVGFYTYDLDEIREEDLDSACDRMKDNPFALGS